MRCAMLVPRTPIRPKGSPCNINEFTSVIMCKRMHIATDADESIQKC